MNGGTSSPGDESTRGARFERHRRELAAHLRRLLVRDDVAEDLVQQTALRALEADSLPEDDRGLRAWLYRVATNLAIDHRRRHATWRETPLLDARERAEGNEAFVEASRSLRGSPEMQSIAREHLVICFTCTARNLPAEQAAALLLKEVEGLTTEETAAALDATFGQAKHWVQAARATLERTYASTCALVAKTGACHQCVELDGFFNGEARDPLAGTAADLDARLAVVCDRRTADLGPWHRRMLRLIDDVLDG
jgi:RNA polymerase sigma-70 factor, ECF subfamily